MPDTFPELPVGGTGGTLASGASAIEIVRWDLTKIERSNRHRIVVGIKLFCDVETGQDIPDGTQFVLHLTESENGKTYRAQAVPTGTWIFGSTKVHFAVNHLTRDA